MDIRSILHLTSEISTKWSAYSIRDRTPICDGGLLVDLAYGDWEYQWYSDGDYWSIVGYHRSDLDSTYIRTQVIPMCAGVHVVGGRQVHVDSIGKCILGIGDDHRVHHILMSSKVFDEMMEDNSIY